MSRVSHLSSLTYSLGWLAADASVGRELAALDEFCTRLRALPSCRASVFVFVIEANLDWMRAKFIATHVRRGGLYFPCTEMCEDPKNHDRPGVWMTNPRKEQMNHDAMFFMQLDCLHSLPLINPRGNHMVSLGETKDIHNTVTTFRDQLKSYRRKLDRVTTDPSKEAKARYTGKSAGSKDDMVIAFQMAITWGMAFLDTPEYVQPFNAEPVSILQRLRPPFNELYDGKSSSSNAPSKL